MSKNTGKSTSRVRCVECAGYRITRGCKTPGGRYYGKDNTTPARLICCRAFVPHATKEALENVS